MTPTSTLPRVDPKVFRFAFFTMAFMVVLNWVTAYVWKGWESVAFNTALFSLAYLAFAIYAKSPILTNLLVMSVVAGWVELWADHWLVDVTKTLVYPEGPKVVDSPIYMPFAWMLVLVQLSMVGVWLRERLSPYIAAFLTAMLGGINIPFYESLAKTADWWIYQGTPMIFYAPYYIILGEFLLCLPLVWIGTRLARTNIGLAVLLGVVEGIVIWIAYVIAFKLVG